MKACIDASPVLLLQPGSLDRQNSGLPYLAYFLKARNCICETIAFSSIINFYLTSMQLVNSLYLSFPSTASHN